MLNQLFRFTAVGGAASLAYLGAAIAGFELIDLWSEYELAASTRLAINAGAFLISIAVAYFGLRRWVFTGNQPHRRAFLRFVALSTAGLAVNEALFYALVRFTPASYQAAFTAALAATACLAFVGSRAWVFAAR